MFKLPENAPWWALAILAGLGLLIFGANRFVHRVWPQNSRDRRALLEARQRDRAERRKERNQRNRQSR
ncbi:hypothetical protein SALB_05873 [Streptomyces noursei]|uniref:Uncharacterized protein n=1 Tax=Streptomyces noursei TaxID=1971 RepID=A0A401R646_STRNR|nr:hypothetical protein SALB_05873 [Streptomyces noursei]